MSDFSKIRHDIAFWTGLYEGDDPIQWASDKAYLDMNRTLIFEKKEKSQKDIENERKGWRDKVTKIIRKALENSTDDFKTWHQTTCEAMIKVYKDKLADGTKLTFGQAQKWLNMTLKYLWLLYRLEVLKDDLKAFEFIEKHQNSFHVPIDSYIKRYVEKQPKSKRKAGPDNNGLSKDISEHLKWGDTSWSHIDGKADIKKYYAYQIELAEFIRPQYSTPLEWELEHWHKALVFYESKQKS